MESRFTDIISQYNLQHHKHLLACSGGMDSMCLAHLLLKSEISFAIAHVNFGLRGDESDGDARFVTDFAAQHNIEYYTKQVNTVQFAESKGISIEMAARELRYNFFEELLREYGLKYVLTAHHLNDDIETLLLKLGRGSSLRGLSGMKPLNGDVFRPLLTISRKDLDAWARAQGLSWREDSSNNSDEYLRNKVRHKIVPLLEETFPNFNKSGALSMALLKDDHEALKGLIAEKLSQYLDGQVLKLNGLIDKPYLNSLLHAWLANYGDWDFVSVNNLVCSQSGAVVQNETWELLKDRDSLILKPLKNEVLPEVSIHLHDNAINVPLSLEFAKIPVEDWTINTSKEVAQLDFEKLQFPLLLRPWRYGDRFQPLGMKNFKKVSDFLIDEKVDRYRKNRTMVLCSGSDIVWVTGYRIDERFKVGYSTKTVYFAHLNQN